MNNIKILGLGHYVPSTIKLNEDFKEIVDTSDEWISSRTGIKQRHLSDGESTYDLALNAAKMAISESNIDSKSIDLVIVATITPDTFTPSTASRLIEELGIENAMAFDISAACSGYVYALNVASALLTANNLKRALVIGSECLSKIVDYKDRGTCVLFGDGAGASVIELDETKTIPYCMSKTDKENILYSNAITSNGVFKGGQIGDFTLKMDGKKVYLFALEAVSDCINNLIQKNNINLSDIDMFIPHQANERIIRSICNHYDLDINKFYLNIQNYGNTSAASIAIALSEGYHKGIIKKGMRIMLIGFGAGLTWAGMVIKL